MRYTTTVKVAGIDDKVYGDCTAAVDEGGVLDVLDEGQRIVDVFDEGDWDSVTIVAEDD